MDDKTATDWLHAMWRDMPRAEQDSDCKRDALQHAIQAIEALGRVRELIASLEAESGNASAGKFIAQELRNRIGDKP